MKWPWAHAANTKNVSHWIADIHPSRSTQTATTSKIFGHQRKNPLLPSYEARPSIRGRATPRSRSFAPEPSVRTEPVLFLSGD